MLLHSSSHLSAVLCVGKLLGPFIAHAVAWLSADLASQGEMSGTLRKKGQVIWSGLLNIHHKSHWVILVLPLESQMWSVSLMTSQSEQRESGIPWELLLLASRDTVL